MLRLSASGLLWLAACGRLGFAPRGAPGDGGPDAALAGDATWSQAPPTQAYLGRSDGIYRVALGDASQQLLVPGPFGPDGNWTSGGVWPDPQGGWLYWVRFNPPGIHRAPLQGGPGELLLSLPGREPDDLIVVERTGKVYWSDNHFDRHALHRMNLDGSGVELVLQGGPNPHGLALDEDQSWLYWCDSRAGAIRRMHLDGQQIEDVVSGLTAPHGLALDPSSGRLYFVESIPARVGYWSVAEGVVYLAQVPLTGDMRGLSAIAYDWSTGTAYVPDENAGRVFTVSAAGEVRDWLTGLGHPAEIVLTP